MRSHAFTRMSDMRALRLSKDANGDLLMPLISVATNRPPLLEWPPDVSHSSWKVIVSAHVAN